MMECMEVKASRRIYTLRMSQFVTSENLALEKLGTEQISQGFGASLPAHTYAMKDGQIQELFYHLFCYRNIAIPLFNGAQVLQFMLSNGQAMAHIPCKMSAPKAFEAQPYFRAMSLMSREVEKKKPNIVQNVVNGMLAGMAVQVVQKAWYTLMMFCPLRSLRIVIQTYLWFSPVVKSFQVLSQRSDGFFSLRQQKSSLKRGHICSTLKERRLP